MILQQNIRNRLGSITANIIDFFNFSSFPKARLPKAVEIQWEVALKYAGIRKIIVLNTAYFAMKVPLFSYSAPGTQAGIMSTVFSYSVCRIRQTLWKILEKLLD